MNGLEKNTVKLVAKTAPWLAPLPSAFFVARSAMAHLALPVPMAVIAAAIIELLGLSTVHAALWLSDYNASKRKIDPTAPTWIAVALGAVYVLATIGLVVALEVAPFLATFAPAIFPVLAIVGAVNLALIAQQERREAAVDAQKKESRERRLSKKASKSVSRTAVQDLSKTDVQETVFETVQDVSGTAQDVQDVQNGVQVASFESVNASRAERKAELLDSLLDIYADDPNAGATAISRQLGIGRSTVYHYLGELEGAGKVRKNGDGVEVIHAG
jgi:hypothetical protein